MKHLILWFVSFLLLTACGGSTGNTPASDSASIQSTPAANALPAWAAQAKALSPGSVVTCAQLLPLLQQAYPPAQFKLLLPSLTDDRKVVPVGLLAFGPSPESARVLVFAVLNNTPPELEVTEWSVYTAFWVGQRVITQQLPNLQQVGGGIDRELTFDYALAEMVDFTVTSKAYEQTSSGRKPMASEQQRKQYSVGPSGDGFTESTLP